MSCANHNQGLLLLGHGELSPLHRMRLLIHLRRCPRCREQQACLASVSAAFAGAIRPRGQGAWSPPRMAAPSGGLAVLDFWLFVLMVACILATLSVTIWHISYLPEERASSASIGCAPSLPNDHCR